MPNATVRANAQAMPIDRRRALLGALAGACAAVTVPGEDGAEAAASKNKVCSVEELAALKFEPWQDVEGEDQFTLANTCLAEMNSRRTDVRVSLLLMTRTKSELEAMAIEMNKGGALENLLDSTAATLNFFKGLTKVLEASELRLLSATASACLSQPEAFSERGEA